MCAIYSRLPGSLDDNSYSVYDDGCRTPHWPRMLSSKKFGLSKPSKGSLAALIFFGIFASTVTTFLGGMQFARHQDASRQLSGVAPHVTLKLSAERFQLDEKFTAPPLARDKTEPAWDSLLPNGLGYVSNDPLSGRNFSVVSVFHQLHCLYTLRRAYYSSSTRGEDFDFGLDRTQHTKHCFEYLRQSLMCSADSTVEPAESAGNGFLGWGFKRQCSSYGELKIWAEQWRAFDAQGFLAHPKHSHVRQG